MAQHDYIIANQSGAAFRSDLNNGLAAIVSQNSGAAQPSTTYAYQWWADTTTGLLKLRNAANNAWITIGTLADVNLGLATLASPTFTGTPAAPTASAGTNTTQLATTAFVLANSLPTTGGTFTGNLTVPSLNGGPLAGFRNVIINGDMRIDQRYSGSALTPVTSPSGSYVVDRWYVTQELGNSWTLQQNRNNVTPPTGFTNYFGIQVNSASTPTTGSYNALAHIIEGFNVSSLGWGSASAQSVTLSFWVRSSVTGQHGGSVRNGAATFVSYPFSYTISAANTWEYKTVTIPGPTTGTFATNNSSGINIFFDLGCGSTSRGTAGSWGTQNVLGATGDVNVISTASATFFLTGVQLEPGAVATPFERRPIGTELSLCQRYFETLNGGTIKAAGEGPAGSEGSRQYFGFATTKRVAPTMAYPTANQANCNLASNSATNGFNVTATTASTGTFGYDYAAGNVTASAEL